MFSKRGLPESILTYFQHEKNNLVLLSRRWRFSQPQSNCAFNVYLVQTNWFELNRATTAGRTSACADLYNINNNNNIYDKFIIPLFLSLKYYVRTVSQFGIRVVYSAYPVKYWSMSELLVYWRLVSHNVCVGYEQSTRCLSIEQAAS